jgi:hypothetical protein
LDSDDAARVARVLVTAIDQEKDPKIGWWLAAALCLVAERMDPAEAGRVCGAAVTAMSKAVTTQKKGPSDFDEPYNRYLLNGFVIVASRQDPAVANRCARVLLDVLVEERNGFLRWTMAKSLAALASHLDQAEAARVCCEAASVLADALKRSPTDTNSLNVAAGLVAVAARMPRTEAERVCGEVARALCEAKGWERSETEDTHPAFPLAVVAAGMNATEAARVLAEALKRDITEDVSMEFPIRTRRRLAESLSSAMSRAQPNAAAQACGTIRSLLRMRSARNRGPSIRSDLDASVAELLPWLDPRSAHAIALVLAANMCSEADVPQDHETLSHVLTDTSRTQQNLRAVRTATQATGLGCSALLASATLLAEPWPCRLSTQELVNLLKMPTCRGKTRQVVLEHLGNIHGHRFANHWEFVRFANEQNLSLDLATPPPRPGPAALNADEAQPH